MWQPLLDSLNSHVVGQSILATNDAWSQYDPVPGGLNYNYISPFSGLAVVAPVYTSASFVRISTTDFFTIELDDQYRELGEALVVLSEFGEDDEFGIEEDVYQVACYAAATLQDRRYQAPKVLSHGPKSVVFNWEAAMGENLYLTISANNVSLLFSTPSRIERRMQFSSKQLGDSKTIFPLVRYAYSGQTLSTLDSVTINPIPSVFPST